MRKKHSIEDMKRIAKERGGKCLSERYVNSQSKLIWRCSEGHEWETKPGHILNGSWCPYCAGTAPLTLDEMKEIAKSHGGECLSEEYTNSHTKLKWRCSEGHEWEAIPSSIKKGTWCSRCNKRKNIHSLDDYE